MSSADKRGEAISGFFDGFQIRERQKESFHRIHYVSKNFKNETLTSEKTKSVFLLTDLKLPKSMHASISRSYQQ